MRYSLRTLLVTMLAASVYCAVLFTVPGPVGLLVLLIFLMLAPGVSVLTIVYGRGPVRAFGIGSASTLANALMLQGLYGSSMVLEEIIGLLTFNDDDVLFGKFVLSVMLTSYVASGWLGLLVYAVLGKEQR